MKIIPLDYLNRLLLRGIFAFILVSSTSVSANHLVFEKTVEMGCFPTLMQKPPCPVPTGIDSTLVAAHPAGKLGIRIFDNDAARFDFKIKGLRRNMVITAWFVHFRPDLGPTHPIFEPAGPGLPPIAYADTPVSPTWARFSEGLSRSGEPNQLQILPNGNGRLKVYLDYNPFKKGQVPLVNGSFTTQGFVPLEFEAEQPDCCLDSPLGRLKTPIGSSFLRKFDPETGFQLRDANGRVETVRSPGRPIAAVLFVHIDGVTSGLVPGFPVPPFIPEAPVTAGSVYLLGVFPLGGIGAQ